MAIKKRWSRRVTETSDALTLDEGVFKREPAAIARSLKRSAERSRRRKSTPFRSAMSMLTFYANRAGSNLPAARRRKIDLAKEELRKLYGKSASTTQGQNRKKAAKGTVPKKRVRSSPTSK